MEIAMSPTRRQRLSVVFLVIRIQQADMTAGRQQYVRVPYADVGPMVIPDDMDHDDAVLLTDVVPTGYQAAEMGRD